MARAQKYTRRVKRTRKQKKTRRTRKHRGGYVPYNPLQNDKYPIPAPSGYPMQSTGALPDPTYRNGITIFG
jgi:hypothetical protein